GDAGELARIALAARPLPGPDRRRSAAGGEARLRAPPAQPGDALARRIAGNGSGRHRGRARARRRWRVSDFQLPPLTVDELPGGLKLVAIQRRGLPLFHARLSLPAGAGTDPAGHAGLAQFTVDLLRRGTLKRSADEID